MADRAREALEEIAEGLAPTRIHLQNPTLAGGHAGISLFYDYLSETGWQGDGEAQAARHLELAIAGAPFLNHLSLFTGLTGIAWSLRHFSRGGESTAASATAGIDDLIAEVVRGPWGSPYDLVYGLTGVGTYVLDHGDTSWTRQVWQQILQRFKELVEASPQKHVWWTRPEHLDANLARRFPRGHVNLGMAHGLAGVIGVLARHPEACPGRHLARSMLEQAVDGLLELEQHGEEKSAFPPYFASLKGSFRSARSGWCYGDPGIAVSLLQAGRALARPDLERYAVALALKDAGRSQAASGVVDAPLCHGAAGLGHLYNRLYQATGEEALARVARRWFAMALDLQRPVGNAGIFPSWWPVERRWHADTGLLDGSVGVGLALLAATTSVEPSWDRPLLLDLKVGLQPKSRVLKDRMEVDLCDYESRMECHETGKHVLSASLAT